MQDQVYGIRTVIEAINSGKNIDIVYVKENLKGDLASELFKTMKQRKVPFQHVPLARINRKCNKNHQGVLAIVAPIEYYNLEDLVLNIFESGKQPLIVILDGITDVRNFGAIARTAECAAADAIVIPDTNSVRITSDAIKASAGALNKIPICKEKNLNDAIILLKQLGIKIVSCTEKTNETIYDFDVSAETPLAIVLGSEKSGISTKVLNQSDAKIKIPILGSISSLNVSVAAGIVLYEIIRKRNL